MAEVVGLAASIITLLQLTETVASASYACYDYYHTTKDAQQIILDILKSVNGLHGVLIDLQKLVNGNTIFEADLAALNEAIQVCRTALGNIATKLKIRQSGATGKQSINFLQKATWSWKRSEIDRSLASIETHKTTFIVILGKANIRTTLKVDESVTRLSSSVEKFTVGMTSLGGNTLQKVTRLEESVTSISNSMLDAQDAQIFGKVLTWLGGPDPSINHEEARNKHQEGTGDWFLRLPQFNRWKQRQIRSIWIHGIPGSGKTILFSSVVEHVKLAALKDPSKPISAIFYFDFNDPEKRTVVGFLRSVLGQFCLQNKFVFEPLLELYRSAGQGRQAPSKTGLIRALRSIVSSTDNYYSILLDAVDECSEREDLSMIISELLRLHPLSWFIASRKEQVFVDDFTGRVEVVIDLRGAGIDGDGEHYIERAVASDRYLRQWPPSLQWEIEQALRRKAGGM